ncbi:MULTISPECIES: hypothetical protein [unclassified Nocardioides]|uniref:hypothetical protein n=1 Tax=unclassified Nocardioides TaxID=2615069 RepID=UPI003015641B
MSTFTRPVRRLLAAATVAAATLALVPAAQAAAPDPFSGERKITLSPEGQEFALSVDRRGQVSSTERWGRRTTFVATRVRGQRFWLQTAQVRRGGKPLCLALTRKRVRATACDAANRNQLFAFRDAGRSSGGDPTYLLRVRAARYLVVSDEGAFAPARISEGTPDIDTPFLLVDRGRAQLPALD